MNIDKIQKNISLAPYTTFKIGGPAEFLVEVKNSTELEEAVRYAVDQELPITILGGGSNVLISDKGLEGLVIINKSRGIEVGDLSSAEVPTTAPRHQAHGSEFYNTEDLTYEDGGQRKTITLDSGVPMSVAIAKSHRSGLTGLCHFAGIPGTVGGALYNNIHGSNKHFSDYFLEAEILEIENGQVTKKVVPFAYFEFGYDQSKLRNNSLGEVVVIVLTVTLSLYEGDVEAATEYANQWRKRKHVKQPWNSAGCVFKNLTPEQQQTIESVTPSWGYVTDKILGWKGKQIGGARISDLHASFIVNETGAASSYEVLELMKSVHGEFRDRFGVWLEPEINLLGFTEDETEGLLVKIAKK